MQHQHSHDLVEMFEEELIGILQTLTPLTGDCFDSDNFLTVIYQMFLKNGHDLYEIHEKVVEEENLRAEMHGLDDFLLLNQSSL